MFSLDILSHRMSVSAILRQLLGAWSRSQRRKSMLREAAGVFATFTNLLLFCFSSVVLVQDFLRLFQSPHRF